MKLKLLHAKYKLANWLVGLWLRLPIIRQRWIRGCADFYEGYSGDPDVDWGYAAIQTYYANLDSHAPLLNPADAAWEDILCWSD